MTIKKKITSKSVDTIRKGDVVYLSYKLCDSKGKLLDESHPSQPIVLKYGVTKANPLLVRELKGKKKGDSFEIKQKKDAKIPIMEVSFDDLEDEDLENLKEGNDFELTVNEKSYLCNVVKIDSSNGKVFLKYKTPYDGKTLINKIKIIDIKKEHQNKKQKNKQEKTQK